MVFRQYAVIPMLLPFHAMEVAAGAEKKPIAFPNLGGRDGVESICK